MKILNKVILSCTFLQLVACYSPQENAYGRPSVKEIEQACEAEKYSDNAMYDLPYARFKIQDTYLKHGKSFMFLEDFNQAITVKNLDKSVLSTGTTGVYRLYLHQ